MCECVDWPSSNHPKSILIGITVIRLNLKCLKLVSLSLVNLLYFIFFFALSVDNLIYTDKLFPVCIEVEGISLCVPMCACAITGTQPSNVTSIEQAIESE